MDTSSVTSRRMVCRSAPVIIAACDGRVGGGVRKGEGEAS